MVFLLADDERMVRFALKSMLLDIVTQDCSIYEATNGKELIEMCELYKPGVAFVDINMPFLDGISAIKQCKECSPGTHFVILTGYSDFAYAQECVSLKIEDYVLKPIDADKLRELYERLTNRLADDMRAGNELFQTRIIQLFSVLHEIGLDDEDEAYFRKDGDSYFGALFFVDCEQNPTAYSHTNKALFQKLNQLGQSLLTNDLHFTPFYFGEGTLTFIVRGQDINTGELTAAVRKICEETGAEQNVRVFFHWDVSRDIIKIYEACSRMEEDKFVSIGTGQRKATDKIDMVTQYIEKNYMHDISVNMLAEKFDLTPNYLSKVFREKKQTKFIDYLTSVRISNAKRILEKSPEVSVKDLTLMVGYYNPRYFTSIFKKATGVYPSDLKKR